MNLPWAVAGTPVLTAEAALPPQERVGNDHLSTDIYDEFTCELHVTEPSMELDMVTDVANGNLW